MNPTGKNYIRFLLLVLCLFVAGSAFADDPKPKGKSQSYIIVSSHTKEECLAALDKISAMGAKELSMWQWGCMAGDHTGYATVKAKSPDEAKGHVPESLRSKAKVVQVGVFTQAQIKAFHNK
jgi:hypothetical protein